MSRKADFPILSRKIKGKNLVYLDSAATALKPWAMIERVGHFLSYETANVHRGSHYLSNQATGFFEEVRGKVSQFLGAKLPEEIIFTRGTTESVNLVAQAWGTQNLKAGDEILISQMEHHSNIVPWQMIAEKAGARVVVFNINQQGDLDVQDFQKKLSGRTKLVAVTHCSNVLGTINDLKPITQAAHKVGALVFVDGAQAVPTMPVSVQDLDIDFYAFSGHKLFAPYGIGVLYGKKATLEKMNPYQGGGSMISQVTFEKTTFNDLPFKFEAGTPNIEGVVGLGAAIDYIQTLGWNWIHAHEQELIAYAKSQLSEVKGLRWLAQPERQAPVLSFEIPGVHASDLAQILDQENIAIRAGHLCAQPLMNLMKVPAFARVSFSIYNQKSDVDQLKAGLLKAQELLS